MQRSPLRSTSPKTCGATHCENHMAWHAHSIPVAKCFEGINETQGDSKSSRGSTAAWSGANQIGDAK
eukprot:2988820-Alexandrium_andersonii.AAC.1